MGAGKSIGVRSENLHFCHASYHTDLALRYDSDRNMKKGEKHHPFLECKILMIK